jgi:DNA integrity scanning protein DisA with diadenylate cyclase activity
MFDSLQDAGTQTLQTIRWADALDVIVVSIMLFGVISWARRSAARNMVAALLAFGVLYFISRGLDMHLTRVFIEAILAVAVSLMQWARGPSVALVVDQRRVPRPGSMCSSAHPWHSPTRGRVA